RRRGAGRPGGVRLAAQPPGRARPADGGGGLEHVSVRLIHKPRGTLGALPPPLGGRAIASGLRWPRAGSCRDTRFCHSGRARPASPGEREPESITTAVRSFAAAGVTGSRRARARRSRARLAGTTARCLRPQAHSARAITRAGLASPPLILSGAAISTNLL